MVDTQGEPTPFDFFHPGNIMAIVAGAMSDFVFLAFIMFTFIPFAGSIVAAIILMFHYFAGIIVAFSLLFRLRHGISKLLVGIGILAPLPLLTLGAGLAMVVDKSRIARFAAKQAAVAAAGALTGGVGAAAGEAAGGAGALAANTATGAAAKGAGTAAEKTAEAAGGGAAKAGAKTAGGRYAERAKEFAAKKLREAGEEQEEGEGQSAGGAGREVEPEELGQEKPIMEKMEEDILGTPPSPEQAPSSVIPFKPHGTPPEENVTIKDEGTVDLRKQKKREVA